MSQPQWLLYGANGHTGRRIAREAALRGMHPILAGRNVQEIDRLAQELDCPSRTFSLNARPLAEHLQNVTLVLNCAGPFTETAARMIDACLEVKASYLDITGEIPAIESAVVRDQRAVAAGVSLISAVGFDVVPSDCLAAMLAARLPGATRLELAFTAMGSISRGTARSMVAQLPAGARIRRDGRVVEVPLGWKTLEAPFPAGPRQAVTISFGDIVTAWMTTHIPNIEVYAALPAWPSRLIRQFRWTFPLLRYQPIREMMSLMVHAMMRGPAPRSEGPTRPAVWGRACDDAGHWVEATLETAEAYELTVLSSLAAVERVLAGGVAPGYQTPARAFGAEFVLGLPETKLNWIKE
jgi:short subunit dehydrogenase-like uncharacterized protein